MKNRYYNMFLSQSPSLLNWESFQVFLELLKVYMDYLVPYEYDNRWYDSTSWNDCKRVKHYWI